MMERGKMRKGQIYSLDFLIATGLMVLAIGVLLGFFETATYQAKEARLKNELNVVALTASNMLVVELGCPENTTTPLSFSAQGYLAYGCYNTAKFSGVTKQNLMIPDAFNCEVLVGNQPTIPNSNPPTPWVNGCSTTDPSAATDVVSVQRNLLAAGPLQKKAYEQCISGQGCPNNTYTDTALTVRVWR